MKTNNFKILTVSFISFILFSLYSCSNSEKENTIKTIDVLNARQTILTISEIAESIEYLPLASDSILAYIMKVVYVDGEYFVKDNKSKLLRFNENGDLINKIGNRGRGPGEYRYASDFVVHPETRHIYIIGGKPEQIMVFSDEGKFLKSIDLTKKYTKSIGITETDLFLFFLDGGLHNKENFELLDTDGNCIKSYPNQYKFERGRAVISFSGECNMYALENKLHFKEIFSDTIFYLDGQNRIPKIILNSGERRFTPEERTKAISEIDAGPRSPRKTMVESLRQNNLFETQAYLFYRYGYDKKGRLLIYNKSTEETIEIVSKEGIINDWDGGPNIQLKMNKDDNTVFAWVNAFDLKSHVASEAFKNSNPKYPEKKKALEKLANSLSENDNPVLMLVKLKE